MADIEKLKQAHKDNGPYHSAREAVQSPTWKAMHKQVNSSRSKALENKKEIKYGGVTNDSTNSRLLRGKERTDAIARLKSEGHIK